MTSIKILIVEDNIEISEELKLRLESLGYRVCGTALRGTEAVIKAEELKPDLVLMDIILNGEMNGIDAAKKIVEKFQIPIVYLTAYTDDETISRAKVTNPYGYIVKPFNESILKTTIEIALNKFELEKKVKENESLLFTTINSLSEAVIASDKFAKIVFMNEFAESLTGIKLSDCRGKDVGSIIDLHKSDGESCNIFKSLLDPVLNQGKLIAECKSRKLINNNEATYYVDLNASPLKDLNGNVTGCVLVLQDVTKKTEADRALIEAKNRAEIANKIKSEFLAQMSHEIRTPINAMLSFASLIRDELQDQVDIEVKEHFDILDNAGKRMARTVDLLLSMSELQSGSYKTKFEKADVYKDIVEGIYLKFAHKALIKNIDFQINNLTTNFDVSVDVNSTKQTISNLVDNAIKYTKTGKVEIRMSRNNKNRLTVEVIDTGIGISEEYKNSLFEPFTQEDQGYTRRYEGTGLGLALAKKYCELNDAKLEFESKKSEGSTFRVIF